MAKQARSIVAFVADTEATVICARSLSSPGTRSRHRAATRSHGDIVISSNRYQFSASVTRAVVAALAGGEARARKLQAMTPVDGAYPGPSAVTAAADEPALG